MVPPPANVSAFDAISRARGEAIAAVMARHFSTRDILTDDRVAREPLPADHQARNTWLRKRL